MFRFNLLNLRVLRQVDRQSFSSTNLSSHLVINHLSHFSSLASPPALGSSGGPMFRILRQMMLDLTVQLQGLFPSIPQAGGGNHGSPRENIQTPDRFLDSRPSLNISFLRRIGSICATFLSPGVFVQCLSAFWSKHIEYVIGGNIIGGCDDSDSVQKLPRWWNAESLAQSESNRECGEMAAVSPGEFMAFRQMQSRNRNTCWEQSLNGLSVMQIIRPKSILLPGFGW